MGAKSRRKAIDRRDRKAMIDRLTQEHANVEAQAELLAQYTDEAVLARAETDRAGQEQRLRHAGYRCMSKGLVGLGLWGHPRGIRIMHSLSREDDGRMWAHESVSHRLNVLPDWYEVRDMHRLLYPGESGLIVVTTEAEHVSLSQVHHVWTCLDGPVIPDFRKLGQI